MAERHLAEIETFASLLQLLKFRFSLLPILLSLLCGLNSLLLLRGGLLLRNLRLRLRVQLSLLRHVALLSGCLRVRSGF